MKKFFALILGVSILSIVIIASADEEHKGKAGEAEFNEHCVVCHPGGGNVFNPQKTLHKKDLEANSIRTPGDIIKIMRNPGPGMTKFDEDTVSDRDAKEIAGYILDTFK